MNKYKNFVQQLVKTSLRKSKKKIYLYVHESKQFSAETINKSSIPPKFPGDTFPADTNK